MLALARRIVSGEEDTEAVEAAFAQARDAESAAEEMLVDDGWKPVEVEPEAVEVNGNGTNGSGHHDAIGPTVELTPRNGHHEEASEPQRTLFSWAEFMAEEPVKPKGRSRKPQPATASLFEWAVSVQQKDGKELVSAGR